MIDNQYQKQIFDFNELSESDILLMEIPRIEFQDTVAIFDDTFSQIWHEDKEKQTYRAHISLIDYLSNSTFIAKIDTTKNKSIINRIEIGNEHIEGIGFLTSEAKFIQKISIKIIGKISCDFYLQSYFDRHNILDERTRIIEEDSFLNSKNLDSIQDKILTVESLLRTRHPIKTIAWVILGALTSVLLFLTNKLSLSLLLFSPDKIGQTNEIK